MTHTPFGPIPDLPGALCAQVDPDLFYPEKGENAAPARRVCMACEERSACLEWAMDRDERWGVWGGSSELERRRARRGAA